MKAGFAWGALVLVVLACGLPLFRGAVAAPGETTAGASAEHTPEDRRPHVEIARPQKKTVYRRLELPGEVLPDQQAAIFARVQGYVAVVHVDRGDSVKAGDPLAEIAVPELDKKLERQKAELALCSPARDRDQATLAWREAAFRRLEGLSRTSVYAVTAEAMDEARGRSEVARAELELTRARADLVRAEIAETQSLRELAALRAPFAGVVTERWVDPGDLAQPGVTKLLQLMKADPVRVRIAVPETDVPHLRADSQARISFGELSGWETRVQVARSFWALTRSTKTMWAEIDLPNADERIRPGMFAHVQVDLEAHPDALVLPAVALVAEKKKTFVYVVKDGVAKKVPVVLGVDDGVEFEAREGIGPADEVVVSGKNMLSDGTEVRTASRR